MSPGSSNAGEVQTALINFLTTNLQVAFAELKTAEAKAGSNPARARFALAKAREALKMVRRFEGRVEDPGVAEDIQTRADALESALRALPPM
jgi:hypothetical protein